MFEDLRRGVAKGHDVGLLKTVLGQFGRVTTADGSRVFHYDADRAGRITWKLVRGVYFAETGMVLPEGLPKRMILLGPDTVKSAEADYPWWPLVRDTAPMGTHGAVFDYKWIGTTVDGGRGHAMAMLLWDRLLTLILFHDPSCRCEQCQASVEASPSQRT